MLSGVPQGSVLGPLLFCYLYSNDIDEFIVGHILKFADDTKIYHVVTSSTTIENLQSDLHNLVAWSNEWQMLSNIEKCKVMYLGYNNPKADYVMDGSVLQCVSEEKNLGVIVSDDFKWERQCCEAVKKVIE